MPAVTVLMPVFNAARHLSAAVDSVLAQTFADFELLIVDDGSTDGSRAILGSYRDRRIRVVELPHNCGLSATLNVGLQEARSDLVARQDADDVSHPERLGRQVSFLRAHREVALLGTQGRIINDAGQFVGVVDRCQDLESIRWYHLWDNPFIHTSVMFRRQVIVECGEFEAAFDPFSQDYAMWSRVLMRHPVANLPERLVHYRISDDSISGGLNMADTSPRDARRPAFERVVRQILGRNLRAFFGEKAVSDSDVTLGCGFVLGLETGAVDAFLALFFRLLSTFEARLPSAARCGLRRTVACQLDTVAYRLLTPRRRTAVRIYARALASDPLLARRLPWPRVMALVLLGARGRGAVKRMALFRRVLAPYL